MTWDAKTTRWAADGASSLSKLLEHEGLYENNALCWLTSRHVDKFLKAINAEEFTKLRDFAKRSICASGEVRPSEFLFLDRLWAASDGRRLVARLAEFDQNWIGRWWVRRNKSGEWWKSDRHHPVECAVIKALSENDFREHASRLSSEIVAVITEIKVVPVFFELLSSELRGLVLGLVLNGHPLPFHEVTEALSERGIPSDVIAIIDNILDLIEESKATDRELNSLVESWRGLSGSDPISVAIVRGHERLDRFLRARWSLSNLSGSSGKPDLWAAQYRYGHDPAFAKAALAVPANFRLELGFELGLRIAEEEAEPSPEKVAEHLNKSGIGTSDRMIDALLPMVELWAALRALVKYEANSWSHKTELVGLRAKVASLAASAPVLWAQSLPWILARSSDLGDVAQAVTLELALTSQEVSAALESACNEDVEQIRLKARGLSVLLRGLEDPESGLAGTLSDAAARHMDGTPAFPHPLAPMSATWLGSTGVERAIVNGVRRASERFAAEVRDQGGDIEEALTKALVKEIEVEFREIQPRLKLFGSRVWSPAPVLSVRQRPLSRSLEEPTYGCDLALLLNATVRNRYKAIWADLIQVKKSSALQHHRRGRLRIDSWRIQSKQLGDILKWSATAAYWLIASAGEVFVIPAKHLLAVKQGRLRSASSQSFTVGYHEVRSVAIPLEQYLVDLLVGQWVGTTSDGVLRIARGDDLNIRPRIVVEVTISVGRENDRL